MAFVGLLLGCEENTDLTALDTQTPVVEGYLYAGQPIDSFRVTQTVSYTGADSIVQPIDGLTITISDGVNEAILTPIGVGLYQNTTFIIQTESNYSMTFDYNDETIFAQTYIPATKIVTSTAETIYLDKIEDTGGFPNIGELEFPDPIELSWDNAEGDYYYVVVQNIEEDPEVTNELLANFGPPGGFRFISEPQIMDFYAINPRREIQQFGTHQIIVYRVNPEYAALYETSGTNSNTIQEPPSNIENGLGIFTGVSTDTVYLEVIKR